MVKDRIDMTDKLTSMQLYLAGDDTSTHNPQAERLKEDEVDIAMTILQQFGQKNEASSRQLNEIKERRAIAALLRKKENNDE